MLQSLKQLYGDNLGASDGEIGHVKDFYFDDQNWAVRYLVADTGSWLTGRQVLFSPHAVSGLYQPGKLLLVKLTKKQIEDSPSIESHKPVSRQYEADYYQYYGWPNYWQGDGLWGATGFPLVVTPLPNPFQTPPAKAASPRPAGTDAHLRSTQAVNGYQLKATDGLAGHVSDFLMDEKSWAIHELVIKTGHRLSGKEVRIKVGKVASISYEESTVFVNLTGEAVEQSPVHGATPAVVAA